MLSCETTCIVYVIIPHENTADVGREEYCTVGCWPTEWIHGNPRSDASAAFGGDHPSDAGCWAQNRQFASSICCGIHQFLFDTRIPILDEVTNSHYRSQEPSFRKQRGALRMKEVPWWISNGKWLRCDVGPWGPQRCHIFFDNRNWQLQLAQAYLFEVQRSPEF